MIDKAHSVKITGQGCQCQKNKGIKFEHKGNLDPKSWSQLKTPKNALLMGTIQSK